jgi:hypothetical protein
MSGTRPQHDKTLTLRLLTLGGGERAILAVELVCLRYHSGLRSTALHTGTNLDSISASSLKTQGIFAIDEALADASEAMVSVCGNDRFVVMGIERYRHLRECELTTALAESQPDLAAGRYVRESVDTHMKRLAKLR